VIDPDKHTAQIAKLDTARILGSRAAETLHQMQPVFDELRKAYLRRLVEKTKAAGKPDEYATWCLSVLSDIEEYLKEISKKGGRAVGKLDKKLRQAESREYEEF